MSILDYKSGKTNCRKCGCIFDYFYNPKYPFCQSCPIYCESCQEKENQLFKNAEIEAREKRIEFEERFEKEDRKNHLYWEPCIICNGKKYINGHPCLSCNQTGKRFTGHVANKDFSLADLQSDIDTILGKKT